MVNVVEYTKTQWTSEKPSAVVEQIGQGHQLPTEALGYSPDAKYRAQVVQAGAVDRILEFMLKTNQPFDQVKKGGDLPCPSIWLNVLNNFCQDGFLQPKSLSRDTQYKIIVNMGPLFQDMSNFERRELFGSKDYWAKCLMFFTNMLYGLLNSEYQRLGDFMLKQKLLKSFLVRVLFLEMAEPPAFQDILDFEGRDERMPKPDIIGLSQTFCALTIKSLMVKREAIVAEEFAAMPIRPEHELTLRSGLFQLLGSSNRPGWFQGGYAATMSIFILLYDRQKRLSPPFGVDSVTETIVPICRSYLVKYAPLSRDRFFFENVMTSMVAVGATLLTPSINNKQAPIDYNVAKAIEAGLMEYCVDCCDTNDSRMAKPLEGMIRTVASTVILDETCKVLQERAAAIRARVERVKERQPVLLRELILIEELLKNPIVKPPPDSETCAFCQEKTKKATTQKCPFCKSIIYCSEDCQRLNWMLHQADCEKTRKTPIAKSQEELHADGKVLFAKHIKKLLMQAALKGIQILDCFVVFDMCETTPLFKTFTLEQFAEKYIQDEDAMSYSKSVLQRNKYEGAITVSFVGFTPDGLNASLLTFPPSTAPLLPSVVSAGHDADKWIAAQSDVARSSLSQVGLQKLQNNPQMWKVALLQTMKP
jgi:hypothetical protein